MANVTKFTQYDELYKEKCFVAWYEAGRPALAKDIEAALPEDEHGRKPHIVVFRTWRRELNWASRADKLDAEVIKGVEDEMVKSRILMLTELAARARKLSNKAEDWLDDHEFDSSSSALQALFKGAELEMKTRGLSSQMMKTIELPDDELMTKARELVERYLEADEKIIDLAEEPEEDEE